MTALEKMIKLEKEARDFGFNYPNQKMILDQVIDECREIQEDIEANSSPAKIQEEIGDLLHAAICLCMFSGFDVEDTLAKIHTKFSARMEALKIVTKEQNLKDLQGQSLEFMLDLWKKAKIMTKATK